MEVFDRKRAIQGLIDEDPRVVRDPLGLLITFVMKHLEVR